jgi:hypothetical protein
LEAIKFPGDQPPVPGEDGIGFGDKGDLLEGTATEALADLSESGSLGIGKAHPGLEGALAGCGSPR